MIEVKVRYVGIDQDTGHPLVLLADDEETQFLPIVIGPYEAGAILAGLERRRFYRPLTHDLLINVIQGLGGQVTKVVISNIDDGTFYALLCIKTPTGLVEIDARPSDALAVALRADAGIYVTDKVAEDAMIAAQQIQGVDEEKEEFRRFLENLTPEDFRKNLDD